MHFFPSQNKYNWIYFFTCLCLITGCGNNLRIEGYFPEPLVNKIPLKAGLILNDSYKNYKHDEIIPQQSSWSIDLGEANTQMIMNVLTGTFDEVRLIDSLPLDPLDYDLDIVLTPYLDKFEFEAPITGNNRYAEAWIQYVINLNDSNGVEITKWIISGYGKHEIGRTNKNLSMNNAVIVAMREVGATFATSINQQPDFISWLDKQNAL